MEYMIDRQESGLDVQLKGHLSFDDNASFRTLLGEVKNSGVQTVIFQLAELESIDSAGLGMLLMAAEISANDGWTMSISGAAGDVRHMLELTHVNRVVKMV